MIIITAKIIFTENTRKSNCVELMRFTEVDFSELILLRQPTTKSSKNQFGRSEVQPSVVGKSLLYASKGTRFSATSRRETEELNFSGSRFNPANKVSHQEQVSRDNFSRSSFRGEGASCFGSFTKE